MSHLSYIFVAGHYVSLNLVETLGEVVATKIAEAETPFSKLVAIAENTVISTVDKNTWTLVYDFSVLGVTMLMFRVNVAHCLPVFCSTLEQATQISVLKYLYRV